MQTTALRCTREEMVRHVLMPRRSMSPRTISLLLLALVSGAACSSRPPPPPRTAEVRLPHFISRFANGLQLLVAPDPTSDLVHVAMRYKVGSNADPRGKSGLAHLVEHLTFEAGPRGEPIRSRLDQVALFHNAFTRADATHFWATGRADRVLSLLAIEARRLAVTCNQIPEDVFARELAVVRTELRNRARDVRDAPGVLLQAAYGSDHPYRRRVIGSDAELAAMTRADACTFLRGHYAADRAILVVTGGVDPKRVEAMVARLFATARVRAANQLPAAAPANQRRVRVEVETDVEKPTLYAAWPLPPANHPDRAAAEIALDLIGGLAAARDKDDDYDIEVDQYGGPDAPLGVLVVSPIGAKADLARAEEDILIAARLATEVEQDSATYSAAMFRALTDTVFRLDSPTARAVAYADALQRGDRDRLLIDALVRLERIEAGKIRSAASTFFDPDQMIAVRARPARTPVGALGTVGYQGAVDVPLPASAIPSEAQRSMTALMPVRKLAGAQRSVLENGLEVILFPSSSVPTFSARVIFRAGTADDPTGGLAAVAAVQALGLTYSLIGQSPQWRNFFTAGGNFERYVGRDIIEFGVDGLTTWSDALISLLGSLLVKGEYLPEWLDAVHKRLVSDEARRSRELYTAVAEAAWGTGSRNARVLGPSIGDIDDDAVDDFRDRFLVARRATLIVTGNFDPKNVLQQIRYSFSGLSSGAPPPADAGLDPDENGISARIGPAIRAIPTTRAADRLLADLIVAVPVSRGTNPAAIQVLKHILDDRAWGLRSRLGAAYSTSAVFFDEPGGATLGIAAEVSADRAADALKSVRADLAALAAGEGDLPARFAAARRRSMEELLAPPSGARGASTMLAAAAARGRGPEAASELANQVAALTLGDLQTIAAAILRPGAQAIIVRGPQTTIQAALKAAGLTSVRAEH